MLLVDPIANYVFCLNIYQRDLCHWWPVGLFCTAWEEETGQFSSFSVLVLDHKFHQINTRLSLPPISSSCSVLPLAFLFFFLLFLHVASSCSCCLLLPPIALFSFSCSSSCLLVLLFLAAASCCLLYHILLLLPFISCYHLFLFLLHKADEATWGLWHSISCEYIEIKSGS